MANAWATKHGFIAEFRRLHAVTLPGRAKYRRVRVDAETLDEARKIAESMEQECRALEVMVYDPGLIRRAQKSGAITRDEADALLKQHPPPVPRIPERKRLTLLDAAREHPSSQRESAAESTRHARELREFTEATGVEFCDELTLQIVQRWTDAQLDSGAPRDTIRHRLLWLKRASRIAGTHGLPDPLTRIQILPRRRAARAKPLQVYSLQEAATVAAACAALDRPRFAAVVLLCVGMGLSVSEVSRLRVESVEGDVLHVGEEGAKNNSRVRSLPMPATVAEAVRQAIAGRASGWLIASDSSRTRGNQLTSEALIHALAPWLQAATGRYLPLGSLRAGFSTWARLVVPSHHLEAYMGHAAGNVAAITARHYVELARAKELRPTARKLNKRLADAMRAAEQDVAPRLQAISAEVQRLRRARKNPPPPTVSPTA